MNLRPWCAALDSIGTEAWLLRELQYVLEPIRANFIDSIIRSRSRSGADGFLRSDLLTYRVALQRGTFEEESVQPVSPARIIWKSVVCVTMFPSNHPLTIMAVVYATSGFQLKMVDTSCSCRLDMA